MRRISEVNIIPGIREKDNPARDKSKRRATPSTVQRQTVQKFITELNHTAKQSESADSAENTTTEQLETVAREIVHEAIPFPRSIGQHPVHSGSTDYPSRAAPEQTNQPHHAPNAPRERADDSRIKRESPPQRTPTPTPQEQARRAYVQQAAKTAAAPQITATPAQARYPIPPTSMAENPPRQRSDGLRTRPAKTMPPDISMPAPQERAHNMFVRQAEKAAAEVLEQPALPNLSDGLPLQKQPRERTDDLKIRTESAQPQKSVKKLPQEQAHRTFLKQKNASRTEDFSVRDPLLTELPEIREVPDFPQHSTFSSEAAPEKSTVTPHIRQAGAWTPRSETVQAANDKKLPTVLARDVLPTPQARMRNAFVKAQKQRSQNPSIESTNPSEQAAPILPQPPVSGTLAITSERPPVTAERKSVSVQAVPPEIQPPSSPMAHLSIHEKPTPNAAPREKSRRGVSIRTRDSEQISAPKVQPKTSVSRTATKRARKAATQDAQRKMLKKSNNRATRAAAAAAKKLAEAAAKAVKELISALASLGGGTALFVVFSIVIVAGAFLASPLGILFADKQESDDTVPLATAIAEIQGEYHAELERLQNGDFASIQIVGQAPDWREVVAVFASKVAGAEDGMDVFTLDKERVELLRQVFWDMCEITTATQTVFVPDSDPDDDVDDSHTETSLTITIIAKTAEQMRLEYAFSKYQNDALDILLENLGSLNIPMGSLTISQEDAIALLENLPDDLDPARKAVVETAVQLVGRVSYFWGGKSLALGWDDRWGTPMEVTAAGSGSTGTVRPFGLDCSGFVDWSFYNATNGAYLPGRGGGAATQHSYCTDISWSEAQPGDLVFYPGDTHVGIVGGRDTGGNLLIVHCSGGANSVVITGSAGFTAVARPDCFAR